MRDEMKINGLMVRIDKTSRVYLPRKLAEVLGMQEMVQLTVVGNGILIEPINFMPKTTAKCSLCGAMEDLMDFGNGTFICSACGKKIMESKEWKKE